MGITPLLVQELFPRRLPVCNLRFDYKFELENKKTNWSGTESLSFLGPKKLH